MNLPGRQSFGGGEGGSPFGRPENMVHQTMNTSKASASKASSNNNHMRSTLGPARLRWTCAGILGLLAGCAVAPPPVLPPAPAPVPTVAAAAPPGVMQRQRSRWVPVDWSELPGWADDTPAAAWPALRAGCTRPAPGWSELCARVQLEAPPADRRCGPPLGDNAPAALPRREPRRQCRRLDHRLLRAAGCGFAPASWGLPLAAACRAGRPGDAAAVLDAPAARHRARSHGRAARPRDRLGRRPARRAGAADPGLGPSELHRRRWPPADGAAGLCRPQRPALPLGRPLAHRQGRTDGRERIVAGHQGLGQGQPEAAAGNAVGQPARVFFSEERCRTRRSAPAAPWACR